MTAMQKMQAAAGGKPLGPNGQPSPAQIEAMRVSWRGVATCRGILLVIPPISCRKADLSVREVDLSVREVDLSVREANPPDQSD
jgi:hypothetical protein